MIFLLHPYGVRKIILMPKLAFSQRFPILLAAHAAVEASRQQCKLLSSFTSNFWNLLTAEV